MKTLLVLSLAVACTAVSAQTPANNPMPDGSRDLYLGLGAVVEPYYQGGRARRTRALPLVQLEWSNGVFIAGMTAGMHLSQQPGLEYGPLLAYHAGRDSDGMGASAGGVTYQSIPGRINPSGGAGEGGADGLAGMDRIRGALQAGGFINYSVTPALRLTNSVLYGAGREHDGMIWSVGVQHSAPDLSAHHRLTWSLGATWANTNYNASYAGVNPGEASNSGHRAYLAGSGVRDVYLGAGWNWALSPSWMLVSRARVTRLQGDARNSPLVQRPTNLSISSGLAYRF